MTNAKIQRSFQTTEFPKRGASALRKRRPKASKFVLLLLPTIMIMMMLVGATMPGTNGADGKTDAKMNYAAKDKGSIHTKGSDTSDSTENSDYGFMMGTTGTTKTSSNKEEPVKLYTDRDVEVVAKTVYGEALVTHSDMEMAAVVWCILNRVDSTGYACGGTIEEVTTFPDQFHGYSEDHPVTEHIKKLVVDVFDRWCVEKNGEQNVGRILPKEYIYFWGEGKHNYFTTEFLGGETWEWEVENPYDN